MLSKQRVCPSAFLGTHALLNSEVLTRCTSVHHVRNRGFLLHSYAVLLVDMALCSDKLENYKKQQSKCSLLVNTFCMVLLKEDILGAEEEEGENKDRREALNLLSSDL